MTARISREVVFRVPAPSPFGDDVEVFEAVRGASAAEDQLYSCVAICRRAWRTSWPALGGTRCLMIDPEVGTQAIERAVRWEAHQLALSMYMKNNLLRLAEKRLRGRTVELFGWQGGKGVIWLPITASERDGGADRQKSPERLMAHGRLVERIGGDYIASKDAGVGRRELLWIERTTRFTIGNQGERDTGEATAEGVASGMRRLWTAGRLGRLPQEPDDSRAKPLEGVTILICGLGKVGLPLLRILADENARLILWEPKLLPLTAERIEEYVDEMRDAGVAVGPALSPEHRSSREAELLLELLQKGDVASDERSALRRGADIVCCAADRTGWLASAISDAEGSDTRYELLIQAETKPRFIVGPGNDQLSMTVVDPQRDRILDALTAAGITFIPDPVVSPGGVISVSHEMGKWSANAVNEDARQIVQASVDALLEAASTVSDSKSLYGAFLKLAGAVDD